MMVLVVSIRSACGVNVFGQEKKKELMNDCLLLVLEKIQESNKAVVESYKYDQYIKWRDYK
jgi:hypothetical protein